jgi:chorismate mutase
MQEIEKLRAEIDEIHGEMAELMRRRLGVARKIWEIKKAQNLSFFDSSREASLIQKYDHLSPDPDEKKAIQNLFKYILHESKTYLETKFK